MPDDIASSGSRENTTAIDSVKATDADSPVYNLAGQKVGASYKGIVIQNGKKRIVRWFMGAKVPDPSAPERR